MNNLPFILAFIFIGSVMNPSSHEHLSQPLPDVPDTLTITENLDNLGARYDRYFTIEEASIKLAIEGRISHRRVPQPLPKENVFRELDQLKVSTPHLVYRQDKRDPRIIHIMDDRLSHGKVYALDNTIASIDFTGLLHDLVGAISKQRIDVSLAAMGTEEFMRTDYRTQVHVQGTKLTVREALTNFIPLKGRRSRVLWVAETQIHRKSTTYVRFQL